MSQKIQSTAASPLFNFDRFILRMAHTEDAEKIVAFYQANKKNFEPTSPPQPKDFYSTDFWINKIEASRIEYQEQKSLRLFLLSTNEKEVLGSVSFTNMCRDPLQACNLGYAIDKAHEGQGLMTQALKPAIAFVFDKLNFHRIMAGYLPENERSARVLKRLGFQIEGLAHRYLLINGKWRDHVLTALINETWRGEGVS